MRNVNNIRANAAYAMILILMLAWTVLGFSRTREGLMSWAVYSPLPARWKRKLKLKSSTNRECWRSACHCHRCSFQFDFLCTPSGSPANVSPRINCSQQADIPQQTPSIYHPIGICWAWTIDTIFSQQSRWLWIVSSSAQLTWSNISHALPSQLW